MNILEHHAKRLLSQRGISIPNGSLATSTAQAELAAINMACHTWVVKAQITAGDRGKAGGVMRAGSTGEVKECARSLLNRTLVTAQTGSAGERVDSVYIEQAVDSVRELYVGLLVDRSTSRVTVLVSANGGEDIESSAARSPALVQRLAIDSLEGLSASQAMELAQKGLALSGQSAHQAADILCTLYQTFLELDATLLEINPLALTVDGELIALDAKLSIDDNALFRQPALAALDVKPVSRDDLGFNLVELDGDIGCLVTGAGLALASMDMLSSYGGAPANFLDLPPTATRVQVAAALTLILAEAHVRCVLVNAVGGGLTRCDVIAEGITTVARESDIKVPIVVRFAGTNMEMGRSLIENSKLDVIWANTMADAAAKAVNAAKGG